RSAPPHPRGRPLPPGRPHRPWGSGSRRGSTSRAGTPPPAGPPRPARAGWHPSGGLPPWPPPPVRQGCRSWSSYGTLYLWTRTPVLASVRRLAGRARRDRSGRRARVIRLSRAPRPPNGHACDPTRGAGCGAGSSEQPEDAVGGDDRGEVALVDPGVVPLAEQGVVVQVGPAAVGPGHDVVRVAPRRGHRAPRDGAATVP